MGDPLPVLLQSDSPRSSPRSSPSISRSHQRGHSVTDVSSITIRAHQRSGRGDESFGVKTDSNDSCITCSGSDEEVNAASPRSHFSYYSDHSLVNGGDGYENCPPDLMAVTPDPKQYLSSSQLGHIDDDDSVVTEDAAQLELGSDFKPLPSSPLRPLLTPTAFSGQSAGSSPFSPSRATVSSGQQALAAMPHDPTLRAVLGRSPSGTFAGAATRYAPPVPPVADGSSGCTLTRSMLTGSMLTGSMLSAPSEHRVPSSEHRVPAEHRVPLKPHVTAGTSALVLGTAASRLANDVASSESGRSCKPQHGDDLFQPESIDACQGGPNNSLLSIIVHQQSVYFHTKCSASAAVRVPPSGRNPTGCRLGRLSVKILQQSLYFGAAVALGAKLSFAALNKMAKIDVWM